MLCFLPINTLALGTLPPEKLKNASGLYNLTRNLGGAIGLAGINTTLDRRFDLHFERLRETLVWGNGRAQEFFAGLAALYGQTGDEARLAATHRLAALAVREATVMALADVFLGISLLFLAGAGLAAFMRRPAAPPPAGAAH